MADHRSVQAPEFRACYLRYHNELFGFLYNMLQSSSQAESMVQEAFLRLLEHLGELGQSQVKSWLYKTAYRLALNALRHQKRRDSWHERAKQGGALPMDYDAGIDPEQKMIEREEEREASQRRQWVLCAQEAIAPRQALLLQLKFSGLSYAEIAEVLEIQPSSVSQLLIRSKRAFRKAYEEISQSHGLRGE